LFSSIHQLLGRMMPFTTTFCCAVSISRGPHRSHIADMEFFRLIAIIVYLSLLFRSKEPQEILIAFRRYPMTKNLGDRRERDIHRVTRSHPQPRGLYE
jgi:hypothetical protein